MCNLIEKKIYKTISYVYHIRLYIFSVFIPHLLSKSNFNLSRFFAKNIYIVYIIHEFFKSLNFFKGISIIENFNEL